MLIYSEKLYFKSPINHVFECFTSYEFNKHFFSHSLDDIDSKEVNLKYNKDLDELTVSSDKPLFKFTSDRIESNKYASGMFIPLADTLKRVGSAKIECWFTEKNEFTEVYCEVNSLKKPGVIWRIFIKIIVFIHKYKNKKDTVNYIKHVESTT